MSMDRSPGHGPALPPARRRWPCRRRPRWCTPRAGHPRWRRRRMTPGPCGTCHTRWTRSKAVPHVSPTARKTTTGLQMRHNWRIETLPHTHACAYLERLRLPWWCAIPMRHTERGVQPLVHHRLPGISIVGAPPGPHLHIKYVTYKNMKWCIDKRLRNQYQNLPLHPCTAHWSNFEKVSCTASPRTLRNLNISTCDTMSDPHQVSEILVEIFTFVMVWRDAVHETFSKFYHKLHMWYDDTSSSFAIFLNSFGFSKFKTYSAPSQKSGFAKETCESLGVFVYTALN